MLWRNLNGWRANIDTSRNSSIIRWLVRSPRPALSSVCKRTLPLGFHVLECRIGRDRCNDNALGVTYGILKLAGECGDDAVPTVDLLAQPCHVAILPIAAVVAHFHRQ